MYYNIGIINMIQKNPVNLIIAYFLYLYVNLYSINWKILKFYYKLI